SDADIEHCPEPEILADTLCTICSWKLRPRVSVALGRAGRSSSRNMLQALITLMRSVSYVSIKKSYLTAGLLQPRKLRQGVRPSGYRVPGGFGRSAKIAWLRHWRARDTRPSRVSDDAGDRA